MDHETEDLLNKIHEVTGDRHSDAFFIKAINELGHERVRSELSEVGSAVREGKAIRNAAAMLTGLLNDAMLQAKAGETTTKNGTGKEKPMTIYSPNAVSLFEEIQNVRLPKLVKGKMTNMPNPYSKKFLPWATIIVPEMFTLSTNKEKSDRVLVRFRVGEGEPIEVWVIRGRISLKGRGRGLLTAEHARVLGALVAIWVDQGCPAQELEDGKGVLCYCQVSATDLAKRLGYKMSSGQILDGLRDKVYDLRNFPYYIEKEPKGESFTWLKDAVNRDVKIGGDPHSWIDVTFSAGFSSQLWRRRTVARDHSLVMLRGEITILLALYLEAILLCHGQHSIGLGKLIGLLALPKADWHEKKGQRKQKFEGAIEELRGHRTADGRMFQLDVEPSSDGKDYVLIARLVSVEDPTVGSK